MRRLIYVAYPIDNAMLTERQVAEIERAKAALLAHDTNPAAAVFDPGDAFLVRKGARPGRELSEVNGHAVDTADGMLAFLPSGVPSTGVPMEIARAGLTGTPVAVVSDSYSWAMHLDRDNVQIFAEGNVEAAIEWLLGYELDDAVGGLVPFGVIGPGKLPTRSYFDDAGLDLYVLENTDLEWGVFKDVPLGIQVALPSWSWGFLVGRSSTFRKRQVEVMPGIIDAGYRGPLFAACIWRPERLREEDVVQDPGTYVLEAGDRIAQMIIIPNGTADVEPMRVGELPGHERGDKGFGSSGS